MPEFQTVQTWDVLGIGSVSVDFLGTLESWPQPGQKVLLERLESADGGLIGTALTAVARLGGRARYIGRQGASEYAVRALSGLQSEGVDTSLAVRDEDSSPHVAIVLTLQGDGERTIFYTRNRVRYPFPEELNGEAWWSGARVLLFDAGSGPAGIAFARAALNHGLVTVIDAEREVDGIDTALNVADHLVVPEEFAVIRAGRGDIPASISRLRSRSGQTVVVTRGSRGWAALSPEGDLLQEPAFSVPVVDTTGCGDVFHGVYALATARGVPLLDACRTASAAAAIAATRPGGRSGIPTLDQLSDFMLRRGYALHPGISRGG